MKFSIKNLFCGLYLLIGIILLPCPVFAKGISSGAKVNYLKPSLYDTGYPYIKYFLDRAFAPGTDFAGLSRSFQLYLGGQSPDDEAMINYGASPYDQSILGRISLEDQYKTTTILDTYVRYFKRLSDSENPLINTNNSYAIKYGPYRMVRILGRNINHWWDTWDWGVDTGASGYLMVYALDAYQKTGNQDYKNLAIFFGDNLIALQDIDGGVRMAPVGVYHPSGLDYYWNTKSTEQNEQALSAFNKLYEVTNDQKYSQKANLVASWLKGMYDKDVHLYHTATRFENNQWKATDFGYVATDVVAFAPLKIMFADAYFGSTQDERDIEVDSMFQAMEERTAFLDVDSNPIFFRFSVSQASNDYGSVEWSAQMALAYLRVAQIYAERGSLQKAGSYLNKYRILVNNIETYFSVPDGSDPNAKVAPYASYQDGRVAGGVPIGTGYFTLNCRAALSSVFYVFAKAGFDPKEADGGLGIPILSDSTLPSTVQVTDEGKFTFKSDQLYLSWTESMDPESGVQGYEYRILQDSINGTLVRDWTFVPAVNNQNYVTAGGLSLKVGKVYYFALRAKNGVGLYSDLAYSDGITLVDLYTRCDINSDGKINAIDVQLVINAVLGLNIGNLDADINLDGKLNAADVQTIVNGALGLIKPLPQNRVNLRPLRILRFKR